MLEACLRHDAKDIVDEVRRAGGGLVGGDPDGELLKAVVDIGAAQRAREGDGLQSARLVEGVG